MAVYLSFMLTEFIDSTWCPELISSKIILVDTGEGNVPMTGANVASKDDYTPRLICRKVNELQLCVLPVLQVVYWH